MICVCSCCREIWNEQKLTHIPLGNYSLHLCPDCYAEYEAINQKPKVGHWIYTKAVTTGEILWSECSECKNGERGCAKRMKYCPNCGCKMEVSA